MVGKRMRQIRESKNLTQTDVAEAVGVNQKTVSRWERRGNVPKDQIGAIADALGVEVSEFEEIRRLSDDVDHNGRVDSRISGFRWCQAVARSGEGAVVRGLLLSLTGFLDEKFWIVTVGMEEFLEVTGLDEKTVRRWWPKMLESGFVESLNPKVEYVFALRFPEP